MTKSNTSVILLLIFDLDNMNDDLKIDVYQQVVNGADCDIETVKKNTCVLFAKKYADCMKEIYFYSSDFMLDGEDVFQMEYNIKYTNGELRYGNCMLDTKDILTAYSFADYDELKDYFARKYSDDENAWQNIIEEMKGKGLSPDVDEQVGDSGFMTNMF